MESQLQQPEYGDTKSPDTTALEPAPLAQRSPAAQSLQKGQSIVTQTSTFLAQLPNYLGRLFNEYKQLIISIGLIIAAIITLRVLLAVIDALNDIPLLAPTFELVGVGYSVWFANRYLLKPSNRQELVQEIQGFLNKQGEDVIMTTESEQLYKPGEIVPQSGQYELINQDGGSEGREITSTKGEHFPPTPESGMRYKLVDATQHKRK